jgi:SAM-dependent methyltransferase
MSTITIDPSPELGGRLLPIAEQMVSLAGVAEDDYVLTAAAGNDALAKAAIRRGARVAPTASIWFSWPDESFDAVLGFFSVTSYREPRAVAAELKRVARPGAPIVLVTWSEQPWGRIETAYEHFSGFPELDVTDHELEESGMGYSIVFARKP